MVWRRGDGVVRELPRLHRYGKVTFLNARRFVLSRRVRARTRTHAGLASMRGISTGSRCRSGSGRRRLCRGGTGFEGLWGWGGDGSPHARGEGEEGVADFLRRAVRERPLPDGCQRGEDGSGHARGHGRGKRGRWGATATGAMAGRFLEAGGSRTAPTRWLSTRGRWVPHARGHGRGKRCRWGATATGAMAGRFLEAGGSRTAPTRWLSTRGDGSPHARGQGEEGVGRGETATGVSSVRWNSPWYGVEGMGWFASCHVVTCYVKVTFLNGAALRPVPPGSGKDEDSRWVGVYEGELD